ncbi:ABC transporter ATP-binding protein/permease [Herbaspirillum sp. RTI4]|uniref:ABC transporter ATP-binding protein/permease n=1 Tax=Herbaspirillum sp. RTI4 TaxID=3048640 RepID=UPI002AB5BDEC|nr:ABC transporter ATP-binding protein/permease [Herbaspirillum sp. RTI4]MDY7577253.1 ABC transporter ATP-binding protein/permease [Herbaspirillum sp. RTI4]MEA9980543.1 ABC transporter ATP-binding protein/permease [Herbaspirillum sp. RTI4]
MNPQVDRAEHTKLRAIWRLIKPYWTSEEKWTAWGLLAIIIGLALGMVYINVEINQWNRDIYDALQNHDFVSFKTLLWRFSYLAVIFICIYISRVYLVQALQIRWRAWMSGRYMEKWLAHRAYYRIEDQHSADNPDQRIAEDLRSLTSDTISLVLGFISSTVTLVSFVGILWAISGPLAFALGGRDWVLPGYMVWFALGYAFIGSWLIWWIGRPLVRQGVTQERFEANFRFGLIRVREHAEAIAFYRGESQEQAELGKRFEDIRKNWWTIMRTTKWLNIASSFYGQFANIFPMLVSAPRYFSSAITLGALMQISSAFGQVQDALSWFINAFSTLASWKASINRLAGFNQAVELAEQLAQQPTIHVERNNVGAILIDGLSLSLPPAADGSDALLIADITAQIHGGQKILVSGPSGCGKSTLFRALAGIWAYGAGDVQIPVQAKLLFLPQRSYLPIGSLRTAISYPAASGTYTDLAIRHYLDLCGLPELQEQLDASRDWSRVLSPGEQQKLAFARIFLTRPDYLFLDEASSAMDGETEEAVYRLLQQELPDTAVISIAHRETLARFHQTRWHFTATAGGVQKTASAKCRLVVSTL